MSKTIYTVTLTTNECDFTPWVSGFDSREKAEAFKKKAVQKITENNIDMIATLDAGEINSEEYLDWLDEFLIPQF